MNLKKNHYSRRALALLLTLVMCVGMIPTAFAAQQNSYHDPAEHLQHAPDRYPLRDRGLGHRGQPIERPWNGAVVL